MPSKGWFNLEAGTSVVPETQFFEGDSAFKFLGLSKTTRLYGFIAWCVSFSLVFCCHLSKSLMTCWMKLGRLGRVYGIYIVLQLGSC